MKIYFASSSRGFREELVFIYTSQRVSGYSQRNAKNKCSIRYKVVNERDPLWIKQNARVAIVSKSNETAREVFTSPS